MIQTQLPFPADGGSNSELEDAHKHVAGMDIKVWMAKGRKSPLTAARSALLKIGQTKNELLSSTEFIQITIFSSKTLGSVLP